MIYIDFDKRILSCFICNSYEKNACDCNYLEVYIYEHMLFWHYNGNPNDFRDPSNESYINYQEKQAPWLLEIKTKYPNAERIEFYPIVYKDVK